MLKLFLASLDDDGGGDCALRFADAEGTDEVDARGFLASLFAF